MVCHLVTVATHNDRYFPILEESCHRYGIKLNVLGWGQKWQGFIWRFTLMKEFIDNIPEDDIVCFIDAYDVVVMKPLSVLEKRFREMNKDIVVSTVDMRGNIIFKMYSNYFWDKCKHKLINAGTYIGYAHALKKMINNICTDHKCHNNKKIDDQLVLTQYCKKHDVGVDVNDTLFYVYVGLTKYDYQKDHCILHAPGNLNIHNILTNLKYDVSKIPYEKMSYWKQFFEHHVLRKEVLVALLVFFVIIFIIIYYSRQGKPLRRKIS